MNRCSWKWIAVLGLGFLAVEVRTEDKAAVFEGKKAKTSYAIGADLARNIKRAGLDVDTEMLLKGMKDVLSGSALLMSEEELRSTLMAFQLELKQRQMMQRRGTPDDAGNAKKAAAPPSSPPGKGG